MKKKLQLKEEECDFANKKYSEYRKKMEGYKLAVFKAEKNSATMIEHETFMKEVEILKEKIIAMDTQHKMKVTQSGSQGKTVNDIRKDMALELEVVDRERVTLVEAEKKLEECQQKRQVMETSNAILKKKNTAILTRLKRQVDEQIEKHEQTTSHINYLMEKIEATRAKLHEVNTEHIIAIE
ncbi:hypothetical protein BsWGS_00705 [Bradybaena similaris]